MCARSLQRVHVSLCASRSDCNNEGSTEGAAFSKTFNQHVAGSIDPFHLGHTGNSGRVGSRRLLLVMCCGGEYTVLALLECCLVLGRVPGRPHEVLRLHSPTRTPEPPPAGCDRAFAGPEKALLLLQRSVATPSQTGQTRTKPTWVILRRHKPHRPRVPTAAGNRRRPGGACCQASKMTAITMPEVRGIM